MIPLELGHIWIGPRPAPTHWMDTYKLTHAHWNYTLYDNAYLSGRRFRCQAQIDEYIKRGEYAGAADLIRYEILFEKGGYIASADSISRRNTDELWARACLYSVYENEVVRPGSMSPIMACDPGDAFLNTIIESLMTIPYFRIGKAWKTTGNSFIARMVEKHRPDIVVFPSHFFIPRHFTGQEYKGDGPIYADQMFGETTNAYSAPPLKERAKMKLGRWRSSILRRLFVNDAQSWSK